MEHHQHHPIESHDQSHSDSSMHALYSALYQDDLDSASSLLNHGAVITPYAALGAIQAKSLRGLQLLVRHGWDVNTAFTEGCTALS